MKKVFNRGCQGCNDKEQQLYDAIEKIIDEGSNCDGKVEPIDAQVALVMVFDVMVHYAQDHDLGPLEFSQAMALVLRERGAVVKVERKDPGPKGEVFH